MRRKELDDWADAKFEALLSRGKRMGRPARWMNAVRSARNDCLHHDFDNWIKYAFVLRTLGNAVDAEIILDILNAYRGK